MTDQTAARKLGKLRLGFITETISELKKVAWPSRRDSTYLTTMVIVVTVSTALILYAFDFGFSELMKFILQLK